MALIKRQSMLETQEGVDLSGGHAQGDSEEARTLLGQPGGWKKAARVQGRGALRRSIRH